MRTKADKGRGFDFYCIFADVHYGWPLMEIHIRQRRTASRGWWRDLLSWAFTHRLQAGLFYRYHSTLGCVLSGSLTNNLWDCWCQIFTGRMPFLSSNRRPASESESEWEWVRKAASASEWDFFSHSHLVRKFLKILSIYSVSRFWLVCTKNWPYNWRNRRIPLFSWLIAMQLHSYRY